MSHEYLTNLNEEQRRAVKHGIDSGSATRAPPLLVIAGAGFGKTKTLAHRVAHLVVSGVDPHRILLLTFTRPSISARPTLNARTSPCGCSCAGLPGLQTPFQRRLRTTPAPSHSMPCTTISFASIRPSK